MKSFLIAAVLVLCTSPVFAGTQTTERAAQFKLNKASPNAMAQTKLGDRLIAGTVHTLRAKYDLSVQGATTAAVTLKDADTGESAVLPKGAIVRDCIIDTITQPDSAAEGSTISIGTGQAANADPRQQ